MEVENENTAVLGSCTVEMYTWPSGECSLLECFAVLLRVQDLVGAGGILCACELCVVLTNRCTGAHRHEQLGGEDNVAVPGSCPADCARMVGGHTTAGGWERLESDVAEDSFATGFRRVCGMVVRARRQAGVPAKRRECV